MSWIAFRQFDHDLAAMANRWVRCSSSTETAVRIAATRLAAFEVGLMFLVALSGAPRAATRVLGSVAIVYVLTEAFGAAFRRERPFARHEHVESLVPHDEGRSFPSRHVASAFAMAATTLPVRPKIANAMWGIGVLLAASRVGAGVHYPSDVFAGALLGTVVGHVVRSR